MRTIVVGLFATLVAFPAFAHEQLKPGEVCMFETKKPAADVIAACTILLRGRNFKNVSDAKLGEFLSVRGRAYWQAENLEAAERDLSLAVALIPRNPMPYYYRGVVYTKQMSHDAAIEDLEKAILLKADDSRFYKNLGVAYHQKGEHSVALVHLTQALKLNPRYDNALYERSGVLLALGRNHEALRDINRAIEIDAEQEYYCQRYWVHIALGNQEAGLRDYARSELMKPGACQGC